MPEYVLITAAHNEEAFIEKTIHAMINQTERPVKWIVVDDASTDRTGEIVAHYMSQHPFIELVNVERPPGRHFGNKVRAFNRGVAETLNTRYEYIGNLDADVSFEPDYFEKILFECQTDPRLGIAGGMVFTSINGKFFSQEVSRDSVAGAVQLFRRACFEQIGGYMIMPFGGIDSAAEITARMKGWRVRTFPKYRVLEHRRTGSATARPLASRIKEGRQFRSLGYGPLFYCLRCIYRSLEKPTLVGSAAALFGYLLGFLKRDPVVLSPEVVRYLKAEQREKLLRWLGCAWLGPGTAGRTISEKHLE